MFKIRANCVSKIVFANFCVSFKIFLLIGTHPTNSLARDITRLVLESANTIDLFAINLFLIYWTFATISIHVLETDEFRNRNGK